MSEAKFSVGDSVLCLEGVMIYDAKVKDIKSEGRKIKYGIHYKGWNKSWDEYVEEDRLLEVNDENRKSQRFLEDEVKKKKKKSTVQKKLVKKVGSDSDNSSREGSKERDYSTKSVAVRLEKLRKDKESGNYVGPSEKEEQAFEGMFQTKIPEGPSTTDTLQQLLIASMMSLKADTTKTKTDLERIGGEVEEVKDNVRKIEDKTEDLERRLKFLEQNQPGGHKRPADVFSTEAISIQGSNQPGTKTVNEKQLSDNYADLLKTVCKERFPLSAKQKSGLVLLLNSMFMDLKLFFFLTQLILSQTMGNYSPRLLRKSPDFCRADLMKLSVRSAVKP